MSTVNPEKMGIDRDINQQTWYFNGIYHHSMAYSPTKHGDSSWDNGI
jgi:hypothetical protein